MGDIPLAKKYSAETHERALSNLVERWRLKDDGEHVKYDEAAINMDKSTVSGSLKYLGEIGILEVPKAGHYIVPEEVVDYRTKRGEVKRKAKVDVESRLEEYALYSEAKFMLRMNDYTIEELAEAVSGSPEVAALKDELKDVERSLSILEILGFLEVDDGGYVSIPDDLEEDPGTGSPGEGTAPQGGTGQELDSPEEAGDPGGEVTAEQTLSSAVGPHESADGGTVARPASVNGGAVARPEGVTSFAVDVDISMDVTEMETDEVREKLEIIHGTLGTDEE